MGRYKTKLQAINEANKRILDEEIEFDTDHPQWGVDPHDYRGYAYLDNTLTGEDQYLQEPGGHWEHFNDPELSDEYEEFEFGDFGDLEKSNIPHEQMGGRISSKEAFDELNLRTPGDTVRIRKNPNWKEYRYKGY